MALKAFSKVASLFSLAEDQIKDIDLISLNSVKSDVDLKQIKGGFMWLVFLLWIGFILFSALYWKFPSNLHNVLKFSGIQSAVFVVISILIYLIGSAAGGSIGGNSADQLPQIAIPIVVQSVISPFLTLAFLGFIVSSMLVGYLFKMVRKQLKPTNYPELASA